jgi:hypothetical protein
MEPLDIVKRAHDDVPPEALSATDELLATFQRPRSRRGVLRLAALGAAGAPPPPPSPRCLSMPRRPPAAAS